LDQATPRRPHKPSAISLSPYVAAPKLQNEPMVVRKFLPGFHHLLYPHETRHRFYAPSSYWIDSDKGYGFDANFREKIHMLWRVGNDAL
jgi:hypothetical protein